MRIVVRLYASLRKYAVEQAPFEVQLPDGATLADLFQTLQLPPEEVKLAFVNGLVQPEDWQLFDGDEVGIFPPVGGGFIG